MLFDTTDSLFLAYARVRLSCELRRERRKEQAQTAVPALPWDTRLVLPFMSALHATILHAIITPVHR
jgi:hypothetical protein